MWNGFNSCFSHFFVTWVVFIWNPENSGFPVFFPDFRDFPSFSKFRKTGKKSGNPEKNPEIRNFRVKFRISGIAHENHSGGWTIKGALWKNCCLVIFPAILRLLAPFGRDAPVFRFFRIRKREIRISSYPGLILGSSRIQRYPICGPRVKGVLVSPLAYSNVIYTYIK